MKVKVKLVKAFTKDPKLGNPAGVVAEADSLSDEQMLSIARYYGFSESAFVQDTNKADFKVRFFAVKQEVDFCGHATVATFYTLSQSGIISVTNGSKTVTQETGIGVLPVTCFSDGKIMMRQNQPTFGSIIQDRANVAKLLGLNETDLASTPTQVVSTGVNKLIVPIKDLETMRKIVPKLTEIVAHEEANDYVGIAVICTESFTGQADLAIRNFSPSVGIDEDPATGIAAGPVGCYADKYIFDGKKKQLVIEQGFDMGKASTLYVDINNGVKVGGYAAYFGEEDLDITDLGSSSPR